MSQVEYEQPKLKFFQARGKEIPSRATLDSAGFDVRADLEKDDVVIFYTGNEVKGTKTVVVDGSGSKRLYINPLERVLVPTGLYIDTPSSLQLGLYARSGTSLKKGLFITNSTGVIDSDYTDQLFVSMTNISGTRVFIEDGERVAQLIPQQMVRVDSEVLKEKPKKKETRSGGFGSTGTN